MPNKPLIWVILSLALIPCAVPTWGQTDILNLVDSEKDFQDLYDKAVRFADQGEPELSREYFEKAIALKPDHTQAYYKLGILNLQLEDAERARHALEAAIDLGIHDPQIYYLHATALVKLEQFEKAEWSYLNATKRNPTMMTAWHDLGVLYYRTNKLEKSIQCLTKALSMKPDSTRTMLMLGLSHIKNEHPELAVEYVTALRAANDQTKALHLENIMKRFEKYRSYQEPDPQFLEPAVPPGAKPKGKPGKAAPAGSKPKQSTGKASITGNATINIKGGAEVESTTTSQTSASSQAQTSTVLTSTS